MRQTIPRHVSKHLVLRDLCSPASPASVVVLVSLVPLLLALDHVLLELHELAAELGLLVRVRVRVRVRGRVRVRARGRVRVRARVRA